MPLCVGDANGITWEPIASYRSVYTFARFPLYLGYHEFVISSAREHERVSRAGLTGFPINFSSFAFARSAWFLSPRLRRVFANADKSTRAWRRSIAAKSRNRGSRGRRVPVSARQIQISVIDLEEVYFGEPPLALKDSRHKGTGRNTSGKRERERGKENGRDQLRAYNSV